MIGREGPPGESRTPWPGERRGAIGAMLASIGALGLALASLLRPPEPTESGYRRVVRWKNPQGEGLFIAVAPNMTPEDMRKLGDRLRWEFRDRLKMVVVIFDEVRAARQVYRGSRYIGEERFQVALAHQRAMYVKDAARGEDRFTILGGPKEVIRF